MKSETKLLGIILFVTLALLFGGVFFLSKQGSPAKNNGSTTTYQIDYSKGQKIGSDSAKVKLVEFSDFECPACAAAAPSVAKYKKGENPNVQFIYRHFPLPQHKFGRQAATIAEAAGDNGKFWEMHDKLFETQIDWSGLSDANTFFLDLAKQMGLDEAQVKKALDENTYRSKIEGDITEGQSLGVNSTPTFFLNGRKLNLRNFSEINTLVEEELKK